MNTPAPTNLPDNSQPSINSATNQAVNQTITPAAYPPPHQASPHTGYSDPNQAAPPVGYPDPNQVAPPVGYPDPNQVAPPTGYPDPNQVAPPTSYPDSNQVAPLTGYPDPNQAAPPTGYPDPNQVAPPTGYPDPNQVAPHVEYPPSSDPYQTPNFLGNPQATPEESAEPYLATGALGKICMVLMVILTLVSIYNISLMKESMSITEAEFFTNQSKILEIDQAQRKLKSLQFYSSLLFITLFCIWTYKTVYNGGILMRSRRQYPKHTPGWSVGSYFIPILNLFQPYQALGETYSSSLPSSTLPLIGFWWTSWLIGGISGLISWLMLRAPETLAKAKEGLTIQIISESATISAGIFLFFIILKLTNAQNKLRLEKDLIIYV